MDHTNVTEKNAHILPKGKAILSKKENGDSAEPNDLTPSPQLLPNKNSHRVAIGPGHHCAPPLFHAQKNSKHRVHRKAKSTGPAQDQFRRIQSTATKRLPPRSPPAPSRMQPSPAPRHENSLLEQKVNQRYCDLVTPRTACPSNNGNTPPH